MGGLFFGHGRKRKLAALTCQTANYKSQQLPALLTCLCRRVAFVLLFMLEYNLLTPQPILPLNTLLSYTKP